MLTVIFLFNKETIGRAVAFPSSSRNLSYDSYVTISIVVCIYYGATKAQDALFKCKVSYSNAHLIDIQNEHMCVNVIIHI